MILNVKGNYYVTFFYFYTCFICTYNNEMALYYWSGLPGLHYLIRPVLAKLGYSTFCIG